MHLDDFGRLLADLLPHSLAAPDRRLFWTIVANPGAGGFTIASRWKAHHAALVAAAEEARRKNPRRMPGSAGGAEPSPFARESGGPVAATGLVATEGPGFAARITERLIRDAAEWPAAFNLIICAGGDGTSQEVLGALLRAPEEITGRFAVLRLPMGTGNDGADSRDMGEALRLLVEPVECAFFPALRLSCATPGKGPWLAFNILSVGLDAFVTHMTNKMKGRLPGDSYKLWVDIASLLYDRIYRVGDMDVSAFDAAGALLREFRERVLLMAMGVSGHRSYGAGKRILPDDRNVCVVRQMPLLRKIALKDLFTTGGHTEMPETTLFSASRLEFRGENPILAQMDGEAVLLETRDFPASIERTRERVPVLRLSGR